MISEKKTVVADASSLIGLSKIGKLHILRDLYDEVNIPQSVYDEVVCKFQRDSEHIKKAEYLRLRKIKDEDLVTFLLGYLGKGEAEVLVLSKELKADLILIDEKKARKIGRRSGFEVIGILGLLLVARNVGLIPAVKPYIERLLQEGFRLSEKIVEEFLKKAGE